MFNRTLGGSYFAFDIESWQGRARISCLEGIQGAVVGLQILHPGNTRDSWGDCSALSWHRVCVGWTHTAWRINAKCSSKHGSWKTQKYNSAWHSALQCCLAALMHRVLAAGGCHGGVFAGSCAGKYSWFLWRTHKNFWYCQSETSNPRALSGIRCEPVLASRAKCGTPAKWHLGGKWDE